MKIILHGDRVEIAGSYDLMQQFKDFIRRNIPASIAKVKQEKKYYRLYIYSYTARMLLELLYTDCHIALDRKLAKAQKHDECFITFSNQKPF